MHVVVWELLIRAKNTFLELKRKKGYRYVIFKIDEKRNEVVVEKTGGPTKNNEDFAESLPENDCRYAVYDFDFVTSEKCRKGKIFFISWSVMWLTSHYAIEFIFFSWNETWYILVVLYSRKQGMPFRKLIWKAMT